MQKHDKSPEMLNNLKQFTHTARYLLLYLNLADFTAHMFYWPQARSLEVCWACAKLYLVPEVRKGSQDEFPYLWIIHNSVKIKLQDVLERKGGRRKEIARCKYFLWGSELAKLLTVFQFTNLKMTLWIKTTLSAIATFDKKDPYSR